MLQFNEEKHEYTLDGKPVPGFSQIVGSVATRYWDEKTKRWYWRSLTGSEFMPDDDTAAEFGRALHDYIRYRLLSIECDFHPGLKPWVDEFERFFEKVLKPLFLDTSKLYVIDWKSSTASQWHWKLQTAAYEEAIRAAFAKADGPLFLVEQPIYHPLLKYAGTPDLVFGDPRARQRHRWSVRFTGKGVPDITKRHNNPEDFIKFTSILNVYNLAA